MHRVQTALGQGIYTIGEAARLVGITPRRAAAWFRGWHGAGTPVLGHTDYADWGHPELVSFPDLVDVVVVAELRRLGVPMPKIRKAYIAISNYFGRAPHPFARRDLLTDSNGDVFLYVARHDGIDELVEVVSRQRAFPKLLMRYLTRINYDPASGLARRMRLTDEIVIDADRRYGKPIVDSVTMPTAILARAFVAHEGDAESAADWHNVAPEDVLAAVAFERNFKGIISEAA